MTTVRSAACVAVVFLITAIGLAGMRPLWIDEILQLLDTRQLPAAELIRVLPRHHTGSAPLGYLVQHATLGITGYSVRRARLPEAIFGSAAVFVVVLLGAELGLKRPWTAGVLYAAFPIVLRYAAEGRMYSQALFFSVLATLLYVRMARRPRWCAAVAYGAVLIAAAYTQPYAAAVGLAHVLWSVMQGERRTACFGAAALAVTAVAFAPWYLFAKSEWSCGIAHAEWTASIPAKAPLIIFREVSGAGYWGSGLILLLCAIAVSQRGLDQRARRLLLLLLALPVAAGLSADAWFHYFLAARQFLWVLPAVAILTAAAFERRSAAVLVLGSLLAMVCARQTVRWFAGSGEDWQAAAAAIARQTQNGACLVVAPPDQLRIYRFFQPELGGGGCSASRIVLAITPYATNRDRRTAVSAVTARGYVLRRREVTGRSSLLLFGSGGGDQTVLVRFPSCRM